MKILHTSDWHLGQDYYTYDRTEEHASFLHQIQDIVKEEKPDVMVVSGDIYHTATPSNTTMKFFNEQLDNIRTAYPEMHIVITAGNHDSSSRLESTKNLWKHLGVSVVGKICKDNGHVLYDDLIIPIKRNKELIGYIIALPHMYPNSYPLDDNETSEESRMDIFMKHLGEAVQEKLDKNDVPVVMMAHMTITGTDIRGHEKTIGGMDEVPIQQLSAVPFDYLALGHIHRTQFVAEKNKAHYCGTPIPVSFDEDFNHTVSIVEIGTQEKTPKVRYIDIENPWPIMTVPSEPLAFDEALQELEKVNNDMKAYVRLNVLLDGVAPVDALIKAEKIVQDKALRLCYIKWNRVNQEQQKAMRTLRMEEFQEKQPLDIAKLYYKNTYNSEMSDRLIELFEEAEKKTSKK